MRKCDKIKDLFGAYIQDDVTSVERAAVEEHVSSCEICADDLESRQQVLAKLKPDLQFSEIPPTTQDDFSSSVYRRIALDAMRQQTRQAFRKRFILQPAFAVLALAAILTIGVIQFHPGDHTQKPSSVAKAEETAQKKLRADLHVAEFFRRQGVVYEDESGYVSTDSASTTEPLSPDIDYFTRDTLLSDSRRRLKEANLINYSLGEPGRALARYQKLVDYYPGTDAAMEARERIKAIQGKESSIRLENADVKRLADTGI